MWYTRHTFFFFFKKDTDWYIEIQIGQPLFIMEHRDSENYRLFGQWIYTCNTDIFLWHQVFFNMISYMIHIDIYDGTPATS